MYEQRIQAYVELIQQLLGCAQGDESALLEANPELVDAGLVAVMWQYVDLMESRGEGNAGWMRQFVGQLAQAQGLAQGDSSSAGDAAGFLMEIVQLIAQTDGDQAQVNAFWRANMGQLNETLLRVLPDVFTTLIQQNDPVMTATMFAAFGNFIQQFPLGSRILNLEMGIAAYEQALTVKTRTEMPIEWATTTMNLATAYYSRIKGDRADNIEQAIEAYEQALLVMTRTEMPIEWATTTMNLANAYCDRIKGDRADNIEQAITIYKKALTVRTQTMMPIEWAQTTMNLATAYKNRIKGNRAENIEQAIATYEQALSIITQTTMPIEWATTTMNLANAYSDRIKGDRAENIEQALDAYQQALTVRTQTTMPIEWAQTVMNLAIAYSDRIKGDRAENIEQAIHAYQQALTVRTQTTMPIEWAQTTMNLATAYYFRIKGDRSENIEQAIDSYEQALLVMTKTAMPIDWATIMMNLAAAYSSRIKNDRSENIEQAIAAYEQALSVRTKTAMPIDWATTMMNLAAAYSSRIKGDRAENIEKAIDTYQQALSVRTKTAMSIDWAATMMNFATAYYLRIKGDRSENIEQAIAAYEQALSVTTKTTMPIDWAGTTMNLATAYYSRIKGDRAENIEQAIGCYEQALTVRTQTTTPIDWAQTIMNLATAYNSRIKGDRAENIEQAIGCYEQALTVRTQSAMPIEWATTTMNLAIAYKERIKGDRAENIEKAIANYRSSLTVFESTRFPDDCRKTARSLANLYSDQQCWSEAAPIYDQALTAAEILYQSATLLDSKSASLSETANLPRRAAYAFARTGDLSKAIPTLEKGRARGLSETLDRDRSNLDNLKAQNDNLYTQYKEITQQLRNLEAQQRNHMTSVDRHSLTPETLRNTSTKLQSDLEATIAQIRQVPGYEDFLTPTKWEDITIALRSDNPLLYIVTTPNGSVTIVVTPDNTEAIWSDFTEAQLQELVQAWLKAYNNSQAVGEASQHENRTTWHNTIESTTRQLWDLLMGPIVQQLKTMGIDRATLIPTGYLSLLPLHAAWTSDIDLKRYPTGKRYALDDLHFTSTPNARSLTEARKITDRAFTDSILAIDNPRQDLPNSQREIDCAIDSFSDRTILRHGNATIDAVKSGLAKAAIVHFSCHGTANFTEPLNSGLLMSDGLLTLKDLLALNLAQDSGIRLAILSACETGLPGLDNIDEVVSLPIGLLQAGVAGVISSLWSVDDASTMMLLTRFYDLWRKEGLEPATALHQAQQWMHSTTDGEKADYCGFLTLTPDEYTYAHPFHWAAFSYLGI
jgi:CHAT domain-containing protein/glutaminase